MVNRRSKKLSAPGIPVAVMVQFFLYLYSMIDPETGTLHLPHNIILASGTNYDALKEALQQADIKFVYEEHYGLFQIIYLNHVAHDNKLFKFELFFDKKILSSMMLDFTCTGNDNQTLEQWLTEQVGNLRQFGWGKVHTGEHPKFCVPLISLQYTQA